MIWILILLCATASAQEWWMNNNQILFSDSTITVSSINIGDTTENVDISYTNVTGTPIAYSSNKGVFDLTASGTYTGTGGSVFFFEINSTGTPNTFDWREETGTWTEDVDMTGLAQELVDGISVTWATTTGHTKGDGGVLGVGSRMRTDQETAFQEIANFDKAVTIAGDLFTNSDAQFAGDVLSKNGDHTYEDGDIHFKPTTNTTTQGLIFYTDEDQGSLEKFRIEFEDDASDGLMKFYGDANMDN
jgi:hypothetical protein